MTQLDRIEQKLNRILSLIDETYLGQDQNPDTLSAAEDAYGPRPFQSGVPPRELRKWPEIKPRERKKQ